MLADDPNNANDTPDGQTSLSELALPVLPRGEPYIKFAGVCKAFGRPVLVDCSFEIYPGETLTIIGPRGSGKSLILRLIMGYEQPDQGQVWAAQELLSSPTVAEQVRKKIAMVSQSGMVLEAVSVIENVRRALDILGSLEEQQIVEISEGLLEIGGIGGSKSLTPAELPMPHRRIVSFLSSLAAQPECVLFDEPTDQLSPLLSKGISELILRLKHQLSLTFVISTNDLDLTRRTADKVLFLDRGNVAIVGDKDELFASRDRRVGRYLRMERN